MGVTECFKKCRRLAEYCLAHKRVAALAVVGLCFFMYLLPLFTNKPSENHLASQTDIIKRCLEDHMLHHYLEIIEGNTNEYKASEDASFLPFVGNGYLGVIINSKSSLFLKKQTTLSLDLRWSPLYHIESPRTEDDTVTLTKYLTGIVNSFECFGNGLRGSYSYYAHRTRPFLFMQEIKISNPTNRNIYTTLRTPDFKPWNELGSRVIKIMEGSTKTLFQLITHVIPAETEEGFELAISIITKIIPELVEVEAHRTKYFSIPTTVYMEKIKKGVFEMKRDVFEKKSIDIMRNVTRVPYIELRNEHIKMWSKIWESGMSISHSKAVGELNGNQINATIYNVLSNVASLNESSLYNKTSMNKHNASNYMYLVEGCYNGYHHTLQAGRLWKHSSNYEELTDTVALWLLTLEKHGCHKLLTSGTLAVMQALVLSFGGFRYNSHHLEFKIDPKFLHRDYFFRRITYDGKTFINVSVTLQDDNKAILGVAIDRTDQTYYACDGGCMEDPVKLSPIISYFPVKKTEPITSILYITSDKGHMEQIKDTLHVHKIVEAPAHDHHVIALHRHGHHLGGLPVLFWASISFLIIVFHLFLCKLIINEYCGRQDRQHKKYGRP